MAGLLPLAALAVLLEAAGAAALITSIGRALGTPGTAGQTAFLAILLSGVFVLRGAVVASVVKRRERAIAETISGLTTRMLDGYLRAPYESMISRHSSLTAQRVTQTVEQVVTLSLVGSFTVAIELFVAVAVVIVLLIATPLAALSAVAATTALVAGGLMLVRPRFSAWSTQQLGLHQQSMKELHEGFGALAEIKVLGTEPFFHQRITNDRRTLANIQAHRRTLSERLRIAIETTVLAAMLLSVIVVVLDGMSAANAVSVLGLYAYAGLRLVPSANRIAASIGLVPVGPRLSVGPVCGVAVALLAAAAIRRGRLPAPARLDDPGRERRIRVSGIGTARPARRRNDHPSRRGRGYRGANRCGKEHADQTPSWPIATNTRAHPDRWRGPAYAPCVVAAGSGLCAAETVSAVGHHSPQHRFWPT